MSYPEYKIKIKKLSKSDIKITSFRLLDNSGDYMDVSMIISKKTIPELIEIIENRDNIVKGKLKNIIINNGYDKIEFRYMGHEKSPIIYIDNEKHKEKESNFRGGSIHISLEPELFWGKGYKDIFPKNVKLLIDELKKYI